MNDMTNVLLEIFGVTPAGIILLGISNQQFNEKNLPPFPLEVSANDSESKN